MYVNGTQKAVIMYLCKRIENVSVNFTDSTLSLSFVVPLVLCTEISPHFVLNNTEADRILNSVSIHRDFYTNSYFERRISL